MPLIQKCLTVFVSIFARKKQDWSKPEGFEDVAQFFLFYVIITTQEFE